MLEPRKSRKMAEEASGEEDPAEPDTRVERKQLQETFESSGPRGSEE